MAGSIKVFTVLIACAATPPLRAAESAGEILPNNLMGHIQQLASDAFEGRAPGTHGGTLTTRYLEDQFRKAGAKPGNPNGTFLQEVPLIGFTSVSQIELTARGKTQALTFLQDYVHDRVAPRAAASLRNIPVVFAGAGIVAPQFGWDDYKNLDVRGKLVIVLGGEPSRPAPDDAKSLDPGFFKGDLRTFHSTRDAKFELAASKGAAGVLVITDPAKSGTFAVFQTFAKMEGNALKSPRGQSPTLISGLITLEAAKRLMSMDGRTLDEMKPQTLGVTARITLQNQVRNFASHNVVARIEGSDPVLKNEYLVYTAHWDHLGRDDKLSGDQIYNGAIDNAVGTAQLIELARAFAALPTKPKRSVLFIAVTAEEKGYLGSRYYLQHPLYPLAKTVANINLDGGNVWGLTADLITTGYGLSTLDEQLAEAARRQGRRFMEGNIDDGGLYFASDQIEFAKVGIPAAFPFSGSEYVGKPKEFGDEKWGAFGENDYHQVTDEIRPDWDLTGAAKDAEWLMIAGRLVADAEKRPAWKPGSEFQRSAR